MASLPKQSCWPWTLYRSPTMTSRRAFHFRPSSSPLSLSLSLSSYPSPLPCSRPISNPTENMLCPQYVWHRMNIYDKVKIPKMNSLKRNSTSLQDQVIRYLTPIKKPIISKFGAMFRIDFEMFGYDWGEMLRWSGHCPSSGPCPLA